MTRINLFLLLTKICMASNVIFLILLSFHLSSWAAVGCFESGMIGMSFSLFALSKSMRLHYDKN